LAPLRKERIYLPLLNYLRGLGNWINPYFRKFRAQGKGQGIWHFKFKVGAIFLDGIIGRGLGPFRKREKFPRAI